MMFLKKKMDPPGIEKSGTPCVIPLLLLVVGTDVWYHFNRTGTGTITGSSLVLVLTTV